MKKFAFIASSLFLSFMICVVSGEWFLRFYDRQKGVTPPYTHNLPETLAVPNGYFNYDLERNIKVIYDAHAPRPFTINRWGFRSPEYDPVKPKDVFRIFSFGGSSTFDPYVADEQTWTALLGKKLSKKLNRKIESINAGRYGYGTSEIVGLFHHRVLRHQPDLIILYAIFNDSNRQLSPYYSVDDGPQYYGNPLLGFLNKNSALFAFLDFRLRYVWKTSTLYGKILPTHVYRHPPPPEHHRFIQDQKRQQAYLRKLFKHNIRTVIHTAKDNHVRVLLVTEMIGKKQYTPSRRLLTEALREIAREEHVPLLDMQQIAMDSKEEGLLQTYVHLTPKGCEYLSDRLAEAILKNKLASH